MTRDASCDSHELDLQRIRKLRNSNSRCMKKRKKLACCTNLLYNDVSRFSEPAILFPHRTKKPFRAVFQVARHLEMLGRKENVFKNQRDCVWRILIGCLQGSKPMKFDLLSDQAFQPSSDKHGGGAVCASF